MSDARGMSKISIFDKEGFIFEDWKTHGIQLGQCDVLVAWNNGGDKSQEYDLRRVLFLQGDNVGDWGNSHELRMKNL